MCVSEGRHDGRGVKKRRKEMEGGKGRGKEKGQRVRGMIG